jgi:hypothetical protein
VKRWLVQDSYSFELLCDKRKYVASSLIVSANQENESVGTLHDGGQRDTAVNMNMYRALAN